MTTDLKPVKFICVTSDNHNKYYDMTPQGDTFLAEYGRVDVTRSTKVYPISKWHSVYKDKIKGGYKDVTNIFKVVTTKKKRDYAPIPNVQIETLFTKLLGYANKSVQDNYSIASTAVTQAQVNEAQAFVNELTKLAQLGTDKAIVNKLLLELYSVIPRRMAKVQDHLVSDSLKTPDILQSFRRIVDAEQKTLDVMAGQVTLGGTEVGDDGETPAQTILDALGISVECGSDLDMTIVRKLMGTDARELKAVYRVLHNETHGRFQRNLQSAKNKTTDLLWHGSRNENWISILKTGLLIRPSNAIASGSMFGDGIYSANKYRKSAGYSSLRGSYWTGGNQSTAFLALMNVHLGNQLHIHRHDHTCYKLCKDELTRRGGYDSVYAHGGADLRNDEFIIYSPSQITIEYLIEVGI